MRRALSIAFRVVALTVLHVVCFAVAAGIAGPRGPALTPQEAASAGRAMAGACFLLTLVLAYLVVRSRWTGARLAATIAFVYYGVSTFMAQIESAVFLTRLPPGTLPRLFLMGALVAVPISALAVLVLGKWRAGTDDDAPEPRLPMPASAWAWRLSAIGVAYVVLYFAFGYYVIWRNPPVRAFYGGVDEGTLLANMGATLRNMPWLVPFQVFRALLWTAIALPIARMMKGGRLETAFATGLSFSVLMAALLLLPNPYMPEIVRRAHMIETGSSNFLFGLLVGGLLARPGGSGAPERVPAVAVRA